MTAWLHVERPYRTLCFAFFPPLALGLIAPLSPVWWLAIGAPALVALVLLSLEWRTLRKARQEQFLGRAATLEKSSGQLAGELDTWFRERFPDHHDSGRP